jgi:hypothetical protein
MIGKESRKIKDCQGVWDNEGRINIMTTHLAIDDDLINEVLSLGHFKTKDDTVTTALREFINCRKQIKILTCSDISTPTQIMATRSGGVLESFSRYLLR